MNVPEKVQQNQPKLSFELPSVEIQIASVMSETNIFEHCISI
jgi:hypothetical protein